MNGQSALTLGTIPKKGNADPGQDNQALFASHGKLAGEIGQITDSLGVRWDAFRSADIKFQVDRVKPQGDGLFNAAKPAFRGPVTVGAIAVDFVF